MYDNVDQQPHVAKHSSARHPLLPLPRIVELAHSLPAAAGNRDAGDFSTVLDSVSTPSHETPTTQTPERIKRRRAWMILGRARQDPVYAAPLETCLNRIRPFTEPIATGMRRPKPVIFLSSLDAATHYHVNSRCNLSLQNRGIKVITVFASHVRGLSTGNTREHFASGELRTLAFPDNPNPGAQPLAPSLGLYPHVSPSLPLPGAVVDEVSVSRGTPFQPRRSHPLERAHLARERRRRAGIEPRSADGCPAPGAANPFDYRVARKLEHLTSRNNPGVHHRRPD